MWSNPISDGIDEGGLRDCFVFAAEGRWYLTGTSSPHWGDGYGNPGVRLYRSNDLVHWQQVGLIVRNPGESKWYASRFWAPEIACIGGRYYCTFNCRNERNGFQVRQSWGIAVSDHVEGPYTVLSDDKPVGAGNDATLYEDEDGQVYVAWCGPSKEHPDGNVMMLARINLQTLELSDVHEIFGGTAGDRHGIGWDECGVEGPAIFKRGSTYYMTYSSWQRGYEVGLATATSLDGKWTKSPDNPLFGSQDRGKWKEAVEGEWRDLGHNTVFTGPDGRLWMSCHGQLRSGRTPMLVIQPLQFDRHGKMLKMDIPWEQQTVTWKAPKSSARKTSTVETVSPVMSVYSQHDSTDVVIDYHAPQRGILHELEITLPKGFVQKWTSNDQNRTTIDIIGRGAVALDYLKEQDMGRHGSNYTRKRVGLAELKTGKDGTATITVRDVDLRPDNGIDVRIVLKGVRPKGRPKVQATWRMSTPVLPPEVRGNAYTMHDTARVFTAETVWSVKPSIQRKRHDARSLGLKGDGTTDDTDALNAAIQMLGREGGGEIDFTDGTFCLRTVHLQSHVWLHIGASATLQAIPGLDEPEETWFADISHNAGNGSLDETPYDTLDNYMTKQDVGHSFFHNCMFFAERQEDIRIYGQGRITGNNVIDTGNGVMGQPRGLRADKMFTFKLCRDIEVGGEDCLTDMWYDVQADEPAYLQSDGSLSVSENRKMLDIDQGGHFVILATGTDGIRVHDIYCGRESLNRARDIFDFMECNDVHVINIYSRTNGDDIVKLGSDCSLGFTRKSRGTYVRNIVGDTNCNLFQIGSETADDIAEVYVDNILVLGTNKAGFSISTNDGGTVEHVFLNSGKTGSLHHRSQMHRTRTPIFLSISNRGRVLGAEAKPYQFRFNAGDKVRNELLVRNIPIGHVRDIDLRHVDCDEIYAGSSYYNNKVRWEPWNGKQAESTPIIAGFKVPEPGMVEGGLDFSLPDGRMTGYIERVSLTDVSITVKGGHPAIDSQRVCPEIGVGKFNIRDLEVQPSYGLWARHVKGLRFDNVTVRSEQPDGRQPVVLDDVEDVSPLIPPFLKVEQ